jgi:hypothetical protein
MSKNDIAIAKLQTEAYHALSSHLEAHQKQIVEIEILPPAIKPQEGLLMEDGLNLGIPKKILALAFVEARKIFFGNSSNKDGHKLAAQATKVILLFESEHLTAANFRKRRLLEFKSDNTPAGRLAYRKALKQEFCFLDSILTSPLHRQSKSPTLWHHRLWLLELFLPRAVETVPEHVRAEFWRTELKSVCKSGERHPKNYYAWQYARRLVERIDGMDATLECAQCVKDWCCKHPSDTSGWSCLLYLLPKVAPVSERTALVQKVMDYTLKLQLENESLWIFIRTIVAHKALQHGRAEFCAALREYGNEIKGIDRSRILLESIEHTLDWINKHGEHENTLEVSS